MEIVPLWVQVLLLLVSLLFFSYFSYKKKALNEEGIIIGNSVGIAVFLLGGLASFFIMVLFFVTAEFSTRLARKKMPEKHEQRTTQNILGNSSAAVIALLFGSSIGFFGAMAAALADTLSSEIGLTSKKKPRLLTTFEQVEAGTDGGITARGLNASLLGAALIAGIHFLLNNNTFLVGILIIAGFLGSLTDSFFGAILETKGKLNNAHVNFLGSGFGALIAYALSLLV